MNDRSTTLEQFKQHLNETFAPTVLELVDESSQHLGHPGVTSATFHLALRMHAPLLQGKTPIQQQRLVYQALTDWLPYPIHAIRFIELA